VPGLVLAWAAGPRSSRPKPSSARIWPTHDIVAFANNIPVALDASYDAIDLRPPSGQNRPTSADILHASQLGSRETNELPDDLRHALETLSDDHLG
jgi:hypothetical protein